jgi:dTDP-4-amino-4,6-dideoxygalactose transaminase
MSENRPRRRPITRRTAPWPQWPQYDQNTSASLAHVLDSGRWSVSSPSRGESSLERQFSTEFAAYNQAPYAISVDHGSSALVVALEALDIGPGDEVIVPVMTWVATASAVLRCGALPVFVDVDPLDGCLDCRDVEAAISDRTRAIVAVHLACTVANIERLLELAEAHGLLLIEDCAQALGACWNGRPVGSFGSIGAFSFNASKVLACGEGGAVVTDDERLYRRLQQLRADSRAYSAGTMRPGRMELEHTGEVMGANRCMSEFQAALLLDRLPQLGAQHELRDTRSGELDQLLAATDVFIPIPARPQVSRRSIFEYGIQFPSGAFGGASVDTVARVLTAELGTYFAPPDTPLHRSPLFRPWTARRFEPIWTEKAAARSIRSDYAGAERYRDRTLLFHHSVLLGSQQDLRDIVDTLLAVRERRLGAR